MMKVLRWLMLFIIKNRYIDIINTLKIQHMTGEAVIKWKGIIFNVEFQYNPFERQTLEHPGQSAHISEISEFRYRGDCFLEFTEGHFYEIEELILNHSL